MEGTEENYKFAKDVKLIKQLITKYGEETSLKDALHKYITPYFFECPKCHGYGYSTEEYNGYPDGLPDSGWVYEPAYKKIRCSLCLGIGYTREEYVEKSHTEVVVDGYEVKK